jgi:hypothetical protein
MFIDELSRVPPHNAPFPFWFWNGSIAPDEVVRQLGLMRDKGIDEVIIHARYGLVTPFLSEAWFVAVDAAVREAARTNMRIWIYDELNWPSGNAAATIPRDRRKREHYLSASGTALPIEDDKWWAHTSVDYLNDEVTREFIRVAYEPYWQRYREHFGKTIAGFFDDEVRFAMARPWSPSLGAPPEAARDYHGALGQKLAERYFEPLRAWCRERNVDLIGHVMGEETLANSVRYVSDVFAPLERFTQPGIDHLGSGADGIHPRIAASVARRLGTRLVPCEVFAALPWDFVPTDLYRVSGWLYATGVTRIILHGFYYQRDGEAAADWPPDIFFRWKHWDDVTAYVRWGARVQYFLRRSEPVIRVALHYPLEEFWDDYQPDVSFVLNYADKGPVVRGERAMRLHRETSLLAQALSRRHIDFDIVPSRYLARMPDHVVVTAASSAPPFTGRIVLQGARGAEEVADEVAAMFPARARASGPGAEPRFLPVPDRIADPYLHEGQDEGGVRIKELVLDGKRALLVFNGNGEPFDGTLTLPTSGSWLVYDPASDTRRTVRALPDATVAMSPYEMALWFEL